MIHTNPNSRATEVSAPQGQWIDGAPTGRGLWIVEGCKSILGETYTIHIIGSLEELGECNWHPSIRRSFLVPTPPPIESKAYREGFDAARLCTRDRNPYIPRTNEAWDWGEGFIDGIYQRAKEDEAAKNDALWKYREGQ